MTIRGLFFSLLTILVVAGGILVWWRWDGEAPTVAGPEAVALGRGGAEVDLTVSDAGSGLRRLRVVLRHAGGEKTLFERAEYPGHFLSGAVAKPSREQVPVSLDPKADGLEEGTAFLEVEAVDWAWSSFLRGNTANVSIPVEVDLTPPKVWVESGLTYVRRAGSAAVVYRVEGSVARDGVRVGDEFFPGFPFPKGGANGANGTNAANGKADSEGQRRFAIFAVPRNAPENPTIRVVATDDAGNETAVGWMARLQDREFPDVRINLSQSFLQSKIPSLSAAVDVEALDLELAFQTINSDIRARNEVQIRNLLTESAQEPLWKGPFQQMRNSAVTSRFAEHRSYFLDKRKISTAIHYGYDLASTAGAPITASNAGRVVFADTLGIYGNCVLLDHGLGLSSLYAHLSRIDVAVGDAVEKGQSLGRSGATGLAGGDHLHFAILVGGSYVDPKEWWDPKWVREHVEARLSAETP